jgi:hypothetical protein
MEINQTHICKSNTQVRLLFFIIALASIIYLIPSSGLAAIRDIKHQPVSLIIEVFTHHNIFDDSSSDIYISKNDESSSEGESSSEDEEDDEDDDDWEA